MHVLYARCCSVHACVHTTTVNLRFHGKFYQWLELQYVRRKIRARGFGWPTITRKKKSKKYRWGCCLCSMVVGVCKIVGWGGGILQ